jgi:hypothetical protein
MDKQTFETEAVYVIGSNKRAVMFFIGDYRIDICDRNQICGLDYKAYQNAASISYSIYKKIDKNDNNSYANISKEDVVKLGIYHWYHNNAHKAEFEHVFEALHILAGDKNSNNGDSYVAAIQEKPCRRCGKMNNIGASVCWNIFFCGVENP